eukprot:jgi/Orpsp1_1/1184550/evm.model.c7180000089992.1
MNSEDAKEWKTAINKELDNMYTCRVMKILNNIPKYMKALDLRWVLTTKDDGTKKARLVVKGFQQRKDFLETYSPTVEADSLRLTVGIASMYNWNLRQIDIKAAYLNTDLDNKIYTKIPIGDKNYNKGKYWLLTKALYGLKQSGRMWYQEISRYLKNIGYKQYINDKCLFGKYDKNNNLIGLLTLYVDDILITGTDETIRTTINKLKQKYRVSKDSTAKKIIGINIYKTNNGYKINQRDYIDKVIKRYKMNKTKELTIPCRKINISDRENSNPVNVNKFKSLLGSLLYISIKTRPDIAYAVNQASRHSEEPREIDYRALMTILQYLKSTKDKSIIYDGSRNFTGYSDSDFAGDEETRKSTSGYIYLLGNSPISWKSQLQRTVTLSSAEAEYVSLTDCATK